MAENQIDRLLAGFDDFRERLARIEEGIKPITDIKKDVDQVKITISEIGASAKSAHKRLDDFDEEMKEIPKTYASKTEHETHDKRIAKLEKIAYWVATSIIGAVILSIMSVVLINS